MQSVQSSQSNITLEEIEKLRKNKHRIRIIVLVVLGLITLGLYITSYCLYIEDLEANANPTGVHNIFSSYELYLKIAEVLTIVFSIEFLFHIIFANLHIKEIQYKIQEDLVKNTNNINDTLNSNQQIMKDNISNSAKAISEILYEKTGKIEEIINQNIVSNKNINDSGIRDVLSFNSADEFLQLILKENSYLDIMSRENSGKPVMVRVMAMYIFELHDNLEIGDLNRRPFIKHLNELLSNRNICIELILPNYFNYDIKALLRLRSKSFEGHINRETQVINTVSNFEKFIKHNEERTLDDKLKFDSKKLKLFFHSQLVSFPLFGIGEIWFKGNYFYNKDAEEIKFVKYSTEIGTSDLGKEIKTHYEEILSKSLPWEEFKNYSDYENQNAGDFLNGLLSEFHTINFDTPHSILPFFTEGASYGFYTHATYTKMDNTVKNNEHFISRNIIKIGTRVGNAYNATLYAKTMENESEVFLENHGKIMYDKAKKNIIMLFYKQHKDEFNKFVSNPQQCSDLVIITGKLPDEFNKDLLILHHTFVSHYKNNNISNIGILDLDCLTKDSTKTPKPIFCTFDLQGAKNSVSDDTMIDNEEILIDDRIKMFLMRKAKVSIKTPQLKSLGKDKQYISKKEDIGKFFKSKYESIFNKIGSYTLYYTKSNLTVKSIDDYGKAELNFLPNGIIDMTLDVISDQGTKETNKYYGELNFQQHGLTKKIISIKFVRSLSNKEEPLKTDYRELFLFLFWNANETQNNEFEITRGIILGDRDKHLGDKLQIDDENPIIESNQCVLVNKPSFEKLSFIGESPKNLIIEADELLKNTSKSLLDKKTEMQFLVINKAMTPTQKIKLDKSSVEIPFGTGFVTMQYDKKTKCKFIDIVTKE